MRTPEKRKGSVYDPGLSPPPRPFTALPAAVRCEGCGEPADTKVNIPGIFVGCYCGSCRAGKLPYPYNGKEREGL